MSPRQSVFFVPAFALAIALMGCGGDDGDAAPIDYYQGDLSATLGSANNKADCALCHDNGDDKNGRSGVSLKDIAFKTSYKGGEAPDLLAGVNACVTGWMGGTALTAESDEYVLLEEYLQSISSDSATTPNPIAPEVLENEAAYEADYAGGDAAAGEAKYARSCGVCHDQALTVGFAPSLSKGAIANRTIGRIAQKVRTSGPPPSGTADTNDRTPGPMPFFEPTDLSQQDLADIIAHLESI